jgi:hypothetical protein
MVFPRRLRRIGIRSYIYGDIDKDGVANIDDPKPYDSKVRSYPNIKNNPSFYHRAQYGGTEIKLSQALRLIERRNNEHIPLLRKFLKAYPNSGARIKTVPSTIEKLERKGGNLVRDRAAGKILTKDRKEAFSQASRFERRFKTDKALFDNFYKKPRESHYALHYGVIGGKDTRMEVQIQSKRMSDLDVKAHPSFKSGIVPKRFVKEGKRLFKLGF